jgi:hypothetical protein
LATRRPALAWLCAAWTAALLHATGSAHAAAGRSSDGYCDPGRPLSAEQKDVVLRFGAAVKHELERSGARVALISRTGLDLQRFSLRYSHAGITLRANPETPWAVRQLYYACDEGRARLFDQGLSAFVLGADDATMGHVSIVFLPEDAAAALERSALDNRLALQLLGAGYSANAYPFSVRYQNCNQWVVELLASAWAAPEDAGTAHPEPPDPRARAQRWLRAEGYEPTEFEVGWAAGTWASTFIPWVHRDDHPPENVARHRYQVSMPDSIEAFVRGRLPGATRVELCHDGRQMVRRQGWDPIPEGCRPGAQDVVMPLP